MTYLRVNVSSETFQTPSQDPPDLLRVAADWQQSVDMRQLTFPAHTVMTSLKSDIILLSVSDRHLIILGLTILWEDRNRG